MTSSAMALTNLPMPKNDDQVLSDKYNGDIKWEGQTKLGKMQTCEAQGIFVPSGLLTMFAYNGMLCIVFYTCAITFGMRNNLLLFKFLTDIQFLRGFVISGESPSRRL